MLWAEEDHGYNEVEVQVEHLEDPKTIAMTMTKQKRWSSHHIMLEEINKVQHMTQSRNKLYTMSDDDVNSETIWPNHQRTTQDTTPKTKLAQI